MFEEVEPASRRSTADLRQGVLMSGIVHRAKCRGHRRRSHQERNRWPSSPTSSTAPVTVNPPLCNPEGLG